MNNKKKILLRDSDWQAGDGGVRYVTSMERRNSSELSKPKYKNPVDMEGLQVEGATSMAWYLQQVLDNMPNDDLPVAICPGDPAGMGKEIEGLGFKVFIVDNRQGVIDGINKEFPLANGQVVLQDYLAEGISSEENVFRGIWSNGALQNIRSLEELIRVIHTFGRSLSIGGVIGLMGKTTPPELQFANYKNAIVHKDAGHYYVVELDDKRPAQEIPGCKMTRRVFTLVPTETKITVVEGVGLEVMEAIKFISGSGFCYDFILARKAGPMLKGAMF